MYCWKKKQSFTVEKGSIVNYTLLINKADHLGSAQLVTNHKGEEYERIEYTPYGETWVEKTSPTNVDLPYKFTGKELDEETGLYYYGARYLDPKTSRWLSTDPALAEYIPQAPVNDEAKRANGNLANGGVYNPVNFHVYHYANNNPIKYSDPDGRIPFMVVTGIVGALIGGGASIASDLMSGEDVNWAKAGAYAVAGGLAGATLGGVAATVATGSALTAGSATASFSAVTGISGKVSTGYAAAGVVKAAQQLKPYAEGGGHHPAAQSAFNGNVLYNAKSALAIPNSVLNKMGISHKAITGVQHTLYSAFAKTGQVLSWDSMAKIETQALIKSGVDPTTAKVWVDTSIKALKETGIINPTRIPWGE